MQPHELSDKVPTLKFEGNDLVEVRTFYKDGSIDIWVSMKRAGREDM